MKQPSPDVFALASDRAAESLTSDRPAEIGARSEQVLLALGVILHLFRVGRPGPDEIATAESTQQGIAATLEVTQGSVSKILQRLAAADIVRHVTCHVRGHDRRVRIYFLTARGVVLAKRYRERYGDQLPAL